MSPKRKQRPHKQAVRDEAVKVEIAADGAARLRYDFSDPEAPTVASDGSQPPPIPSEERFEPGSFGARVLSRRQNLVRNLAEGVPPIEYLAGSEGMLVRGRRHYLAAPKKTGKSIAIEAHACDMIQAGSSGVVILDRENGAAEYGRRLAEIVEYKGYSKKEVGRIAAGLHYFDFPNLDRDDGAAFALAMTDLAADLVVFDSQRTFLTLFRLKEDSADEYGEFMDIAVDPLFESGIATLILDNTGHDNQKRGRGTSAKGDLNEVLFGLESTDFDRRRTGRVDLRVEASRFGTTDSEWTMEIGGGVFGSFLTSAEARPRADFQEAAEEVLRDAGKPLGGAKVTEKVRERGVKIAQSVGLELLRSYAAGDESPISRSTEGQGGYVLG